MKNHLNHKILLQNHQEVQVLAAVELEVQDPLHQVVEIQVHQNNFISAKLSKTQNTDKKGSEILICLEVRKESCRKI